MPKNSNLDYLHYPNRLWPNLAQHGLKLLTCPNLA